MMEICLILIFLYYEVYDLFFSWLEVWNEFKFFNIFFENRILLEYYIEILSV